jgi:hypothetical protein
MGAIIAEMLLFELLIGVGLAYSAVTLLIKLLKRVGRFSIETLKPEIERIWEEWQQKQSEARKPADIQNAAKDARIMVERILTDYHQETGEILRSPWPNGKQKNQYLDKVIYLSTVKKGTGQNGQ